MKLSIYFRAHAANFIALAVVMGAYALGIIAPSEAGTGAVMVALATQQRIRRTIFQQAFATNSQISIPLGRNYDYEAIAIRISGTATLPVALPAGSNGFKPALRSDAPCGLISNVQLIVEGRNTLVNVPFHVLNQANFRRPRNYFAMTSVDTYGATQHPGLVRNVATASSVLTENTAINFEATAFIDLQMILGARAKDSVLRSGGLQQLELRLTTTDSTGLFYQPGATLLTTPFAAPAVGATLGATVASTVVLSNVNIYVSDAEIQEIGDQNGAVSVPGYSQRWSYQEVNVASANSNFELPLPTDNFIGGVILHSKISNESVDGIITNAILRRGVDVRYNAVIRDIIAANERDYRHPRFAGYYYLDLMGSGAVYEKIADAWNVQGGADTRLAMTLQNPGNNVTVGATTIELLPLAPR